MITSTRNPPVPQAARPRVAGSEELQAHFRSLLSRLPWPADDDNRAARTLGVTSCYSGEGVSTVAVQLAIAAAHCGDRRVLLVDANPTRAAVHRLFDIADGSGWTDVVEERADLAAAVQPTEIPNLFLMAAGQPPSAARRIDDSMRLRRAIQEIRADFDLAVFDLPAAGEAAGADHLVGLLDGVLLVVEAERVRWQVAQRTKERLLRSDARLLGAVLNKRQRHVPGWLYQTL